MRKLSVPGLLPLAFCLSAVACGGDNAGPPARFLSIATGGTGGVYYPYGGGLAKVLNESLPGIRATAEVTAASVDNLKLIRDSKADIAFTLADTLADAIDGPRRVRRRSGAGREPGGALRQLHAHRDDRARGHRIGRRSARQGGLDRIARAAAPK